MIENTFENKEEWRLVVGYNNKYLVSNTGRVIKRDGKELKQQITKKNRKTVMLYPPMKNYLVHRIVATAFIQNPENKPQVNHIDGNPLNNNVNNLEWVTAKENVRHAWENGLSKKRKLPQSEIMEIRKRRQKPIYAKNIKTGIVKKYNSLLDCASELGTKQGAISRAAHYYTTSKGYLFSFNKLFVQNPISKRYRTPVKAIDTKGNVFIYNSSNEAGKSLNLDPCFIRKVCKNIYSQYKGYKFSYYDK